jgi:hypothetical protein
MQIGSSGRRYMIYQKSLFCAIQHPNSNGLEKSLRNSGSIPSLLFCPAEGKPQMVMGALPKESLKNAINEILLKKKIIETA